jgi:hypothetical protein
MGGAESIFGSEAQDDEAEQPGVAQPTKPAPPPLHPALLELARRNITASEGRLPQGARGVSMGLASAAAADGAEGAEPAPREGVLSPVDCCVLSLAMPLAAAEPAPAPAPEPEPPQPAAGGPPSDPDEMRLWLQAQMTASAAAPEPEPEPQPQPSEAVPPSPEPSVADAWQQLYDSHEAGTAIHTFGRGVSGYDGPSLLVLRVRPTPAFAGTPPAKAGLIGAYLDTVRTPAHSAR